MAGPIVFSHPGCGPFAQHAARALYEAGLLSEYVTTFHYDRTSRLGRLLYVALSAIYPNPEKQLARRQISELPPALILGYPLPEIARMAASKLGPIAGDLAWEQTEKWFDRLVARNHLNGTEAVYGFEHACLTSFLTQKSRGKLCLYEMPSNHHAATAELLNPEFERYPEIVSRYERHIRCLAAKRNRRKDLELRMADLVLTN